MVKTLRKGEYVACVIADAEYKQFQMDLCDNICKGVGNCILISKDKEWDEEKRKNSFRTDTKLILLSVVQNEIDQNIALNTTKHVKLALQYMKEFGLGVLIPTSSETWEKKGSAIRRNSSLRETDMPNHQFYDKGIQIHYFKLL